jgi:CPA1 family monovalent cation:H+ antiporter
MSVTTLLATFGTAPEQGGAVLATVESFALLLGVAALVALVARRVNVPYSVALVLVGLAVSAASPGSGIEISPELVLVVLLPGLVFEAAYQIDVRELRRSFGWVVVLAAPGVLVSAAIVAVVLHLATGMDLGIAFLVGAMVSATDPVAVVATFRRLRSPGRLATLVEAESLFNDGTAIVVFAIALRAIAGPVTAADALVSFVAAVALSGVIGGVAGFAASRVIARVDDHLIELTISVVLAYGTYLLADELHQSGIIATVVAGAVLGSYGRQIGMSKRTVEALDTVWEFVAFILNAIVFLLIGIATSVSGLVDALPSIAWGIVAIVAGRAIVIYGILGVPARLAHTKAGSPAIPVAWLHVMFWAGLRGAVAMALALSLPADLAQRSLVQGIVFGIVLFTLLVQGTTIGLVVRRPGVGAEPLQARPESVGPAREGPTGST